MDLTGKPVSYIKKRLRQKGYLKNTSQRGIQQYPQTMQSVMQNMRGQGNASFYQVSKQDPDSPQYKSKYEWLFDPVKGVSWDFNPVQLRQLAQDDAWVQMLVNTMTTEMANTPWQIVEDDNPEVAKSLNPFQRVAKGKTGKQANDLDAKAATRFLEQPNPDDNFSSFLEQLAADRLEIGSMAAPKAFSESDYGGEDGNTLVSQNPDLQAITVSDPATFTKDYQGKTGIVKGYWQYDRNVSQRSNSVVGRGGARRTKPIQFKREELAWKDLNPRSNRRYGLPPTLAVRDILMLLDMTLDQEQDYWSRGAFPNGMIKSNGDINELGQLQDEAQGERGRQGGILHVSDPEAEWVQMASNWKDMEMTEREKWYAKIIASEFQVPMSVVGLKPEEVNRSTFEGERDNFESNTLGPHLQDFERWITQNIVKPHFNKDLRFEFVPGTSENQKSSISDEFQNNLITRNEARQQLGYEELEDETEDGFKDDVTEESESPFDQIAQSTQKEKEDGKDDVGKPFGPWESFEGCVTQMQDEQGYDEETAEQVCGSLQAELKQGEEPTEKQIEKAEETVTTNKECEQCGDSITKSDNKRFCSKSCYNSFLSKEDDEPLRSDEEYFKYDFQPRHVEQFKQELQEPINESLKRIFQDDRFNQLVNRFAEMEEHDTTQKNSAELRRVLNDLIKDAALTETIEQVIGDQSTSIAVTALQDQINDSADIDEVEKQIRERDLGFVQNFSQRMEEDIRNTVAEGWQQGQSTQEIQENLQEKAEDLSDYQAERIARDQLQRATGESRNAFAEQHSDKFVEVWNAVDDNRTRPSHSEMDGTWKRPSESFMVPYERAKGTVKENFPGSSKYGIMCRCRTDLVPIDSVSESNHGGE